MKSQTEGGVIYLVLGYKIDLNLPYVGLFCITV